MGFAALAINPFSWRAWASPIVWFGTELPALTSYALRAPDNDTLVWLSLFDKAAWMPLRVSVVAGVLVLALAFVTSMLNRRRVNLGLLLACVALTILGSFSQHDIAPAISAAVVLAAINGQDWYRDRCRQEYSIATAEVLYSRGGRALTVLGFAVVAYLALSGRLMGRDGKRVGVGFAPQLAANVNGSKDDFSKLTNARLFQFRLDQGDLAIWAGQKVFVDSRVGLYTRGGDNILAMHEQARTAFRREQPGAVGAASERVAKAALVKEITDRFNVTHVTARLWGVSPGYQSFWDLTDTEDWTLVRLGATSGVFARTANVVPPGTKEQPIPADKDSSLSFETLAFKDCYRSTQFPARTNWPRPRTGYEEFLSLKPVPISNAVQRSRHYLQMLNGLQKRRRPTTRGDLLGLAVLAVREANAALVEDVNNVSAYILLSDAYSVLGAVENQICANSGLPLPTPQRQFQSLAAIQQASVLEPTNVAILGVLTGKYLALQRRDLAFATCRQALDVLRAAPTLSADDLTLVKQLNELRGQLEPLEEQAEKFVTKATEEKAEVREIAQNLQNSGFPLRALQLLEADKVALANNLQLQLEVALLLADCGRFEDAAARFDSFDEIGGHAGVGIGVWQVQAALVAIAHGDYDRAIVHCRKEVQQLERTSVEGLLSTSPLMMPPPPLMAAKALWPFTHVAATASTVLTVCETTALLRWSMINCHLESGNCDEAARELRLLLKQSPDSPFRALAREYLALVTGELEPVLPPDETVPVLFGDGTGDSEMEEPAPAKPVTK